MLEAYHGQEGLDAIAADDRQADEDYEKQFLAENPDAKPNRQQYPLTDLGNSMRFVADHGDHIRYCHTAGKWLIWDGKRWRWDVTGRIVHRAKLTVLKMFKEAYGDDRGSSHAGRSQSARSIEAMIKLAKDARPIETSELDRDPMLFNCVNGTIDLSTGKLRPHRQSDLITKMSPTPFTPDAKGEAWEKFLDETFVDTITFLLQKLLGYCLTGLTVEHILAIFYGCGANGKSTLVEAVLHAIGEDYSMQAPPNFLMVKRNDSHPTEQADLMGKRFVTCVETGEGGRLNEALLKSLTGGDKIRARFMRQDFFEFEASHKLILSTNHKPAVRGSDHGIWRRLRLVPFTKTVPIEKQDKKLPAKLRRESAAILAWLVEGCLTWKREGLTPLPEAIEDATSGYRLSEDLIGSFIDERCIVGPAYRCRASQLYEAYGQWSKENGEFTLTQRKFGSAMTERGYVREKVGIYWYHGIGIMQDLDDSDPVLS